MMLNVERTDDINAIMNSHNSSKVILPCSLDFADNEISAMNRKLNCNGCIVNADDGKFIENFIRIDNDVGETDVDVNFNSCADLNDVCANKEQSFPNIPIIRIDSNFNETNECNDVNNDSSDSEDGDNCKTYNAMDSLTPDDTTEGVPKGRVRRMGIIPEEPPDFTGERRGSQSQEQMDRRISFLMKRKLSAEMRNSDNDLDKLKTLTGKLNLQTRRPSYVQWKAEHLEKPLLVKLKPGKVLDDIRSEQTLDQRKTEIDRAIKWLRKELLEMREGDQKLARQLVTLRHEISQLKLQHSCNQYEEMIDDAQFDLEENGAMSDMCDLPLHMRRVYHTPLRQLGVTPMNIATRRFSLC